MTERRGDQGFSVAPQRIGDGPGGPRRRRRPARGVAVVGAIAIGLIAVAAIGPRLNDRPNFDVAFFATPTPDPSRGDAPTPTDEPFGTPRSTPLPAVSRPGGAALSGTILYQNYGLHSIDLGTGDVIDGPDIQLGRDALLPVADGDGWTCICFSDGEVDDDSKSVQRRDVSVLHLEASGTEVDARHIGSFEVTIPLEPGPFDLTTDVDAFDDGRRALLALASRSAGPWRISIAPVDLEGRTMGRLVALDAALEPPDLPSPSPVGSAPRSEPAPGEPDQPIESYLDGPHVRVAPDGRYAFVWVIVQTQDPEGASAMTVHAWRVDLERDGAIGAISPVTGFSRLPSFCGSLGFAAADRAVYLCPQFEFNAPDNAQGWVLGSIGPGGEAAGEVVLTSTEGGWYSEPLFDRANGLIYAWDPMNLVMIRVDVRMLAIETATIDPGAQTTGGIGGRGEVRPAWADADSAVEQFSYGQLAGAPDGSRIYALAYAPQTSFEAMNPASRGVFVFDRSTLALLDRWAPAANYLSIAATRDGRVAVGGTPGFDEAGREAPWDASLTIYDATDGQLLVRFGRLGQDGPPFIVDR